MVYKLSLLTYLCILLAAAGLFALYRVVQMAALNPFPGPSPQTFGLLARGLPYNLSIPGEDCTIATCPISEGQVLYYPSLAGNAFFLAYFCLLLAVQLALCVWYRTWAYGIGTVLGMALEVSGYVGRVKMALNPFQRAQFLQYITSLTVGPTFLCAAIYLCVSRLFAIYGPRYSLLSPRANNVIFMTSDFISLLLQAGGGALAAIADDNTTLYNGIDVMTAGLALQVFSLIVVLLLAAVFARRCWRGRPHFEERYAAVRDRPGFKRFLWSLLASAILILIRSIFRVVELSGGFKGPIWNNEKLFLTLDGMMVAVACLLMTVFHPGRAFMARPLWGGQKASVAESEVGMSYYGPPGSALDSKPRDGSAE